MTNDPKILKKTRSHDFGGFSIEPDDILDAGLRVAKPNKGPAIPYRLQSIPLTSITGESYLQKRASTQLNPTPDSEDERFVESIRVYGNFQPIIVMENQPDPGKPPTYTRLAGSRRQAACKLVGREFINAIIFPYTDNIGIYDITLLENTLRQELSSYETAESYVTARAKSPDLSVRKLAERLFVSSGTLANHFTAFENTPDALMGIWRESRIGERSVLELLDVFKAVPTEKHAELAETVCGLGLAQHKNLKEAVRNGKDPFAEIESIGKGDARDDEPRYARPSSKTAKKKKSSLVFPFPKDARQISLLTGINTVQAKKIIEGGKNIGASDLTLYAAGLYASASGKSDRALAVAAEAAENDKVARLILGEIRARQLAIRLASKKGAGPGVQQFLKAVFKSEVQLPAAKATKKK